MTTFSLKELLDLAEAEGRARYAEGYRAGLAAADEARAAEWAEEQAETLDAEAHAAAVAVVAGLADAPLSRSFASLNIDPVTADSDTLRQAAGFMRYREAERVRAHVAGEVAA